MSSDSSLAVPGAFHLERTVRAAVFTDTIDEINGVVYSCRGLMNWIAEAHPPLEVTFFGLSRRSDTTSLEQILIRRYRPRLAHPMLGYREHTGGFLPRRRIEKDFVEGRYDVVHLLTPGMMGNLGRDLALRYGLPLAGTYFTRFPTFFREYASRYLPVPFLLRAFDRYAFRRMRQTYGPCDVVLCQAGNFLDEVRRFYDGDARVWTTGVDVNRFRPKDSGPAFRQRHGIRAAHVGLYVGRIALEKRLDVLVDVLRDTSDLDLELVMVGDGPHRARLQQRLKGIYTGYLTDEALVDAYAAADFFLFPSDTDAYGIVVMESLAAGVPVIINARSGGAETVAACGGGIVYYQYSELVQAVRRLCENPAEREEMAQRGLQYAREHTWEHSSLEILNVYREIIARRRGEPAPIRPRVARF